MTKQRNNLLIDRFWGRLFFIFLCSALISGCGGSDRNDQGSTNLDQNSPVTSLTSVDQFKELVAKNNIVMVDFYADWCPPCKVLKPIIHDVAVQYRDQVTVVAVDIDKFGDLATQFNISSIPTVNMFKAGVFVHSLVGAQAKDRYTEVIDRMLSN